MGHDDFPSKTGVHVKGFFILGVLLGDDVPGVHKPFGGDHQALKQ
jgi:hypothetical protein